MRTEAVAGAVAREVALEGPTGCSTKRLWEVLGEALGCEGPLEGAQRRFAWQCALALVRSGSLSLHNQPASARASSAPAAAESWPTASADDARNANADALPPSLLLLASAPLRSAALGLHDPGCALGEQLSLIHRAVLATAGACRAEGAVQCDTAAAFGQKNNNFFYVVSRLEARGLLVRYSVNLKGSGDTERTRNVPTCMLVLPRFQEAYERARAGGGPHQVAARPGPVCAVFTEAGEAAGAAGAAGAAPAPRAAVLWTDCQLAKNCISTLAAPPYSGRAEEGTLKAASGIKGADGHRAWRRIKPRLIQLGLLTTDSIDAADDAGAAAEDGDAAVTIVKETKRGITLLRGWAASDEAAFGVGFVRRSARAEEELAGGEGDEEGEGDAGGEVFADASLEAQLLEAVAEAGAEGVQQCALMQRFGLLGGREAFARIDTRLVPSSLVQSFTLQQGRTQQRMLRLASHSDAPLPEPHALSAEGAEGAAGQRPGIDRRSRVLGADGLKLRREVILRHLAAAPHGIITRGGAIRATREAQPAGSAQFDRKTVEKTIAMLEEEKLLRTWTLSLATKAGVQHTHHLLSLPAPAEGPDTYLDHGHAAIAVAAFDKLARGGSREPREGGAAPARAQPRAPAPTAPHLPPMTSARQSMWAKAWGVALPKPADEAAEEEEPTAGGSSSFALNSLLRNQEKRRLGGVRARFRRVAALHGWLVGSRGAGARAVEEAEAMLGGDGPAPVQLENVAEEVPLSLALQFISHYAPASAAAAEPLLPAGFIGRVEALLISSEGAATVSALTPADQATLLNPSTRKHLSQAFATLTSLRLLQPSAPGASSLLPSAVGTLDVPFVDATPSEREAEGEGEGGKKPAFCLRRMPLQSEPQVTAYWRALEGLSRSKQGKGRGGGGGAAASPVPRPFCWLEGGGGEYSQPTGWTIPKGAAALTAVQRAKLHIHLEGGGGGSTSNVGALAASLGLGIVETTGVLREEEKEADKVHKARDKALVARAAARLGEDDSGEEYEEEEEEEEEEEGEEGQRKARRLSASDQLAQMVSSGNAFFPRGGNKRKAAAAAAAQHKKGRSGSAPSFEEVASLAISAANAATNNDARARAPLPWTAGAARLPAPPLPTVSRAEQERREKEKAAAAAAVEAEAEEALRGPVAINVRAPTGFGARAPGRKPAAAAKTGAAAGKKRAVGWADGGMSDSGEDERDGEGGAGAAARPKAPTRQRKAGGAAGAAPHAAATPSTVPPLPSLLSASETCARWRAILEAPLPAGETDTAALRRAACELLLLHLMHVAAAAPPSPAHPAALAAALRRPTLPSHAVVRSALRSAGEAAVGRALSVLAEAGLVSQGPVCSPLFLELAFACAPFGDGLGAQTAEAAEALARALGVDGGEEVGVGADLGGGAGPTRTPLSAGSVATAFTLVASGAARLTLCPPQGAGGVVSLAKFCPSHIMTEAPRPQTLWRYLFPLRLRRCSRDEAAAEAEAEGEEGGGEWDEDDAAGAAAQPHGAAGPSGEPQPAPMETDLAPAGAEEAAAASAAAATPFSLPRLGGLPPLTAGEMLSEVLAAAAPKRLLAWALRCPGAPAPKLLSALPLLQQPQAADALQQLVTSGALVRVSTGLGGGGAAAKRPMALRRGPVAEAEEEPLYFPAPGAVQML